MYADDTTAYGNIEDVPFGTFETNINSNLQHLNSWFKFNKLSLFKYNKIKLNILSL